MYCALLCRAAEVVSLGSQCEELKLGCPARSYPVLLGPAAPWSPVSPLGPPQQLPDPAGSPVASGRLRCQTHGCESPGRLLQKAAPHEALHRRMGETGRS
uniref:Uncharacterized protein n=1 Tax=Knipowitschia caucasica TaxID=637954 RepID=A0AAV2MHN3_KNICA